MKRTVGDGPSRFACKDCPDYRHHVGALPLKQKGITMYAGDRYCLGGKRGRKFRSGDPKVYVPAWCPKQKSPRELRIYSFKSPQDWYFHEDECRRMGKDVLPSAFRYAVEFELHTDLTARDFWKGLKENTAACLLGAVVHRHHVVEIDDGLRPVFFYCTEGGFQILPLFNAEVARQNKMTN